MPEIVNEIPERTGRPGRSLYNWDEWLDGQIRKFQQGVDFKAKPQSFVTSAHGAAKKRGLAIESRIRGEYVWIQSTPRDAAPEPAPEPEQVEDFPEEQSVDAHEHVAVHEHVEEPAPEDAGVFG